MGTLRNFIDIIGLTPEKDLPNKIYGQLIENSESQNIFLEDYKVNIKNIFQVVVSVDIKNKRIINTPLNKIVIIDAVKKFKILYYDFKDSANVIEMKIPFNDFFEVANTGDSVDDIKIYLADAYFQMVSKNILYANLMYLLDIHYSNVSKDINQNCKSIEEVVISSDSSQGPKIIDIDDEYI